MQTTWKYLALSLVASAGLLSCSPPPFACTDEGTANCDGDTTNACEVTLATDPANCGECGVACAAAANASGICTDGTCGIACSDGFKNCDNGAENGCEVDVRVTVAHCGACGQACVAPANAVATCGASNCGFTCNEGFADCDEDASNGCEVDTRTNADHCNACGNACADVAGGTGTCAASTCGFACDGDHGDCDGSAANGCEADLRVDADHCGSCETACSDRDNAAATCAAKSCGIDCGEGFDNCDENEANGCEVPLVNNLDNCGACGNACVAPEHAVPVCEGTSCAYACVEGFDDCDGNAANGCEVELSTSTDHCNACNNACAATVNAAPTCTADGCSFACNGGFGDCTDAAGCETNVVGNEEHCNACGNTCTAGPHAVPVCNAAGCDYECETGFADCDGQAANGCEIDTRNDPLNCGGCSVAGSFACPARGNATATCASSQCGSLCNAGFGNCDAIADNGCEEPLNTVDSCGTCDTTCAAQANGAAACNVVEGVASCGVTCNTGFGNCDTTVSNGCEVPLNTDSNCGTCGNTCPDRANSVGECTPAGACGLVCNVGFDDCDDNAANGCEVNLATSAANCGICGNVCATPANGAGICESAGGGSSACDFACNAGFDDCDAAAGNGCEQPLNTTTHCRACNAACAAGDACGATGCTSCGLDMASVTLVDGQLYTYTANVSGTSRIASHTCQSNGAGSEVIIPVTVTARRRLSVETSDAFDTIVSVRRQCAVNTADLACNDDGGPGNGSGLSVTLDPGTYYVVIDRYSSTAAFDVVAKLRLFNPAPGAVCTTAEPLTAAGLTAQDLSFGIQRAATPPCTTSNVGPSRYYTYSVPAATSSVLTLTPTTSFGSSIRVLDSCAATSCVASNGSSTAGTTAKTVTIENRDPATARSLIIEVSGAELWADAGQFDLSVVESPLAVVPAANAACSAPIALSLGVPVTGQYGELGGNVSTACTTAYTGTPLYYSVVIAPFSSVIVTATPGAAATGFNPALRAVDGCSLTATCLGSNNAAAAGAAETLQFGNPGATPVTAIVMVSGSSSGTTSTGLFTVGAVAGPPISPNASCDTASTLAIGATLSSQNCAGGAAASSQCTTSYPGRALFYKVTAPALSVVTVTATPTGGATNTFNPTIRVASSCSATTCAVQQNAGAAGAPEVAVFTNTTAAPVDYIVIVAGSSTSGGNGEGTFDITAISEAALPNVACTGAIEVADRGAVFAQDLSRGGDPFAGTSCYVTTAKSLWYKTTVPANSAASIRVQPQISSSSTSSSWDAVVRVVTSCSATSCVAGSLNNVVSTSFLTEPLVYLNTTADPQSVFINVSSSSATALGRFDMEVAHLAWPQASVTDCAGATVLAGTGTYYGTTSLNTAVSRTSSGCTGLSSTAFGPQYYSVTVPAGQQLSAKATALTAFNIQVRAYDSCSTTTGAFTCLAHSDRNSNSGAAESMIYVNSTASPQTVQLMVGANSASTNGPFRLDVRVGAPRYTVAVTSDAAANCVDMTSAPLLAVRDTGNDSSTLGAQLPFPVQYFGTTVRSWIAGVDGYMAVFPHDKPWFSTGSLTYSNVQMPYAMPLDGMIAPFWDDMYFAAGVTQGQIKAVTSTPAAPGDPRTFTVGWIGLAATSSAGTQSLNFQVKFRETSNVIEFLYCNIVAGTGTTHDGSAASIGMESTDAADAVVISTNTAVAGGLNGKRYVFTPVP